MTGDHGDPSHHGAMGIQVKLDLMLVKRRMKLTGLSDRVGVSVTHLPLLRTGEVEGMRFSTPEYILP